MRFFPIFWDMKWYFINTFYITLLQICIKCHRTLQWMYNLTIGPPYQSRTINSNVQDRYWLNVVDYGTSKLNLTSLWFLSVQYRLGNCLEYYQLSYKRPSLGLILRKFVDDVKLKVYKVHFQHSWMYLILKKLKATQLYRKYKQTRK
jgi:hypothetical protein